MTQNKSKKQKKLKTLALVEKPFRGVIHVLNSAAHAFSLQI